MNSWSVIDYGDFDRARAILEFQRDHQRADGKLEHELTQSGALLDWSKHPSGYYHQKRATLPKPSSTGARHCLTESGNPRSLRENTGDSQGGVGVRQFLRDTILLKLV